MVVFESVNHGLDIFNTGPDCGGVRCDTCGVFDPVDVDADEAHGSLDTVQHGQEAGTGEVVLVCHYFLFLFFFALGVFVQVEEQTTGNLACERRWRGDTVFAFLAAHGDIFVIGGCGGCGGLGLKAIGFLDDRFQQ